MGKLYQKAEIDNEKHKNAEEPPVTQDSVDLMNKKLQKIAEYFEKSKIDEYIELSNKPGRLIWLNFLSGLSRGFGTAIGFTVLSAIALYVLKEVVQLNLPGIGRYIADIVKIVEKSK